MEQHLYDLLISGQQGCKASQLALLNKFEPLLKKYAWYLSYEDALQDLQLGFLQLL